jgi:serine/threonine protein kinase
VRWPVGIRVSKEGKELMIRMLDKDPEKRIDAFGILQHRWFEMSDVEIEESANKANYRYLNLSMKRNNEKFGEFRLDG